MPNNEKLGIGNIYILDIGDVPHWEYCIETDEYWWYDPKKPIRYSIPTTELKEDS